MQNKIKKSIMDFIKKFNEHCYYMHITYQKFINHKKLPSIIEKYVNINDVEYILNDKDTYQIISIQFIPITPLPPIKDVDIIDVNLNNCNDLRIVNRDMVINLNLKGVYIKC